MHFLDSHKKSDTLAVAPIPPRLRKNQRVAILTEDKVQDLEFFYPYYRFAEEGFDVDVFTCKGGKFEGKNGFGLMESKSVEDARVENYVLLYIPGGKAPTKLREDQNAMSFVKAFVASGKPIAAICHGPQLLCEADAIRGRRIAAWPEIRDEVEKAGATFVDEALVEDGQFITGRMPGDLHRHLYGVMDILLHHGAGRAAAMQQRMSAA